MSSIPSLVLFNYSIMLRFLLLILTFSTLSSCDLSFSSDAPESTLPLNKDRIWAIAIHGGAGHFGVEDLNEMEQLAYEQSLGEALEMGQSLLMEGRSAVDVVEAVVRLMEDDSLFNAGRGAVFTSEGIHELDASIADGASRNCGAVTGIHGFRHPISVARSVMDSSEHVFFSGDGAGIFAATMGHEVAEDSWFDTEKAYQRYLRAQARALQQASVNSSIEVLDAPDAMEAKKGTVGCVALDQGGNLAAATSTGGMTFKEHGRIGDSPIVGAGTWADNRTCAISATGWGEYFIRTGVAHEIHGRMLHGGAGLKEACQGAIFDEMGALGGDGGVVGVDANGNIALVCNSAGMFRAWATPDSSGIAMFGVSESGTIEAH